MDQSQVVVDKLVTALNLAGYYGVDLADLGAKLQDGVLSEHETAQLKAQVRKAIEKREAADLAKNLRRQATNMAETAKQARAEAEANPDSKILQRLAQDAEQRLKDLEAKAAAAEAAA